MRESPNQVQNPRAPMGGETKQDQENYAGQPLGSCALAPALEHGNQSNKEKEECSAAQNSYQHDRILSRRQI